jgi:hypothetical protein
MSEWQDISTAPKDQTSVWLGHISGLMVPAYFRRVGSGFWAELYTSLPVSWRPTHWQHLPKPPITNPHASESSQDGQ